MPAKVPDFATLSEAAYEAAEGYASHLEHCRECGEGPLCFDACTLKANYTERKAAALKAIRGPRGKRG